MDHAFGARAAFGLGMEQELFLVDPGTHQLVHDASDVLAALPPGAGDVMHDTYEGLVESASPVVADAREGGVVLADQRERLRAAGATLLGAGLHPDAQFGDVVHVPRDRYRAIADSMRGLLERTPTAANHVHVGMPDSETAIAACNRMRAHLPVLQGLSAHSPYWHGRDSGFASARAQLFRGYPRAEIPRRFHDWQDYVEMVGAVVRYGDLADYTFLWWDIRPHPKLGTLEIRAMDAQSRLDAVIGLAALVHALVLACVEADPAADARLPPREAISESSFRASRDGLDATIWHEGSLRPLREVAAAALELARAHSPEPDALAGVERILAAGGGAARMRAAYARGGMAELLRTLAEETAAPA